MRQVVTAVAQECRKLGRLVLESEFGPYLAEAAEGVIAQGTRAGRITTVVALTPW